MHPAAAVVHQEVAVLVPAHSSNRFLGQPVTIATVITRAMEPSTRTLLASDTQPVLVPAVSSQACHNSLVLLWSLTESAFTVGESDQLMEGIWEWLLTWPTVGKASSKH